MGVTTHQPRSRISATFCVQLVYTQLLALVYIGRATVGTGTHTPAAYSEVAASTTVVSNMCTRRVANHVQGETSLWIVCPRGISLLSLVRLHFYSLLIPSC